MKFSAVDILIVSRFMRPSFLKSIQKQSTTLHFLQLTIPDVKCQCTAIDEDQGYIGLDKKLFFVM